MLNLTNIIGFDWDDGNDRKNDKHGVSMSETEQLFFNDPLLLLKMPNTARRNRAFTHRAKLTKDGCGTLLLPFEKRTR
ncbi:MAG: hypothetical protein DID92_2727744179 [Candidatus Nitrotoga sp. SPKER]|nr:MAG: hypothetical protein DID92_2727744179 [Candidatus Nitrotoga sp. SPKER]